MEYKSEVHQVQSKIKNKIKTKKTIFIYWSFSRRTILLKSLITILLCNTTIEKDISLFLSRHCETLRMNWLVSSKRISWQLLRYKITAEQQRAEIMETWIADESLIRDNCGECWVFLIVTILCGLNRLPLRNAIKACINYYRSGGGSMSKAALSRSDSSPRKFSSAAGRFRSSQLGVNFTDSGPLSRNGRFSAAVASVKYV